MSTSDKDSTKSPARPFPTERKGSGSPSSKDTLKKTGKDLVGVDSAGKEKTKGPVGPEETRRGEQGKVPEEEKKKKDDSLTLIPMPVSGGSPSPFMTIEEMSKKGFHVLVGMPCYGDVLHTGTFKAMLKVFSTSEKLGIGISVNTLGAESLIHRARNYFVAEMLGHKEYTHLMFIDSDITFVPEALLRLLAADKPVIGGVYPLKALQTEKMKELIKKDPKISEVELFQKSLRYATNPSSKPGKQLVITHGLMQVEELATGFMLIKREVLEKLAKAYPDLKYKNDVAGYENSHTKENFYDLFQCTIHPENRRLLSEDYAFCLKCKQNSIEVWADVTCELVHTGGMNFPGAYWKSLDLKPMKS